jgi:hypothetical protein
MNKKIKITVRFPTELKNLMLQAVISDEYGLRGKSTWLSEAIENFVKMDYLALVDIGSEMSTGELKKTESFYLSPLVVDILEEAVLNVRRTYPKIEGVKSIIIRSSVFQRLFRSKKHAISIIKNLSSDLTNL